MLPQQDLLVGLAQIALTVTGFAALVTVFRRTEKGWKPNELLGLYIILEFSVGSTFFAMFPVLVAYLSGQIEGVWRISALVHVLFGIDWILLMSYRVFKVRRKYKLWGLHPVTTILLTIVPFPLLVLQIFNAAWLDDFGIYFLHTLYLMLVSGIQFIIFVYSYASDHINDQDDST